MSGYIGKTHVYAIIFSVERSEASRLKIQPSIAFGDWKNAIGDDAVISTFLSLGGQVIINHY